MGCSRHANRGLHDARSRQARRAGLAIVISCMTYLSSLFRNVLLRFRRISSLVSSSLPGDSFSSLYFAFFKVFFRYLRSFRAFGLEFSFSAVPCPETTIPGRDILGPWPESKNAAISARVNVIVEDIRSS